MCIDNARPFKGKKSEVRWVWKVCYLNTEEKSPRLCPEWQGLIPHTIGEWTQTNYGPGWHAYGGKERAEIYRSSDCVFVRCRVRGIRYTNKYGDVIAEWMFISKKEAEKALRGAK